MIGAATWVNVTRCLPEVDSILQLCCRRIYPKSLQEKSRAVALYILAARSLSWEIPICYISSGHENRS